MRRTFAISVVLLAHACVVLGDPPVVVMGYSIDAVETNATGWQVAGTVRDGSASGFDGLNIPTSGLVVCESIYGDVDSYRFSVVTQTVTRATLLLVYVGTNAAPRVGSPTYGGALLCEEYLNTGIPLPTFYNRGGPSPYLRDGVAARSLYKLTQLASAVSFTGIVAGAYVSGSGVAGIPTTVTGLVDRSAYSTDTNSTLTWLSSVGSSQAVVRTYVDAVSNMVVLASNEAVRLTANSVTNLDYGGTSGTTGSLIRAGNNYTVTFPSPGSPTLVAHYDVTTPVASLTFTGWSTNASRLDIYASAASSYVAAVDTFQIRPNGSTSALYVQEAMRVVNTTFGAAASATETRFFMYIPGTYGLGAYFGGGRGTLFDPNSSIKYKSYAGDWNHFATNIVSSGQQAGLFYGVWRSTSVVTSLVFSAGSGNLASNSWIEVWEVNP